jgi:type I restriction enzyme M protein
LATIERIGGAARNEQGGSALLTGEIRRQIDDIWNDFWSGGVSNPLSVIEQITYLLFIKRLDEIHTLEERRSQTLRAPMERRIFPPGLDERGRPYEDLRWRRFNGFEPREMFQVVDEHVFPFLRTLGGNGSALAQHMKDARLGIATPALLAKAVDKLDRVDMQDRDTKGDVYEYMLGKIATAGQNGQFRTPRHIIALMVELTAPQPADLICDPACGTAGFLVAAGEYLRRNHPEIFRDPALRRHFHERAFTGFDFDATMLRIGAMNMMLHGIEDAGIHHRDSLAEDHAADTARYSLVLANPPFAGSLDYEACAKDLQQIVKTKKTELLFVALFLRLLRTGGRAAVIVPEGVLFGSSTAHRKIRHMLVEQHKLDAVIKLPAGVFRPYAGVSTAILAFTKTGVGGTDHVWFYDVAADGWSLDDKRQPLLADDKLGPTPSAALSDAEHAKNNLPDMARRWRERDGSERERPRTAQSFCVPKADIAANGYDLSLNRYKEIAHAEIEHDPPAKIIAELKRLEAEIAAGLRQLEEMLG